MSTLNATAQARIRHWLLHDFDESKVEAELKNQNTQAMEIDFFLVEFKKAKSKRRQSNGLILTAVGALLGFISCILTLVNPIPSLFNAILYGLTSVAVMVIILGLYFWLE